MKFIVVGIFGSYTEAEAAVLDLDLRGIGGNQVEMISDIDEDARTANTPGEQPNYIGEQEFYANHVKQGGAILIVRTEAEQNANEAAAILREHGARTPGRKDGPAVRRVASGG